MRCGYTVICDELVSDGTKVNTLWARRQATKFNGVNYITQRAAEAVFTDEGQQQAKDVMKGLKSAAGWLRREVGHKACGSPAAKIPRTSGIRCRTA